MRESEDFYKIKKILTFEEWKERMTRWLQEQQNLLHKYTELYLNAPAENIPEEERTRYNERVLALADAIPHNIRMLKRVEIEKDYMILYQEDGTLGCALVSPDERRDIYSRERMRRRLVV